MANCRYIIKLPGGNEITLPAGFSTIEKSDILIEEYDNYLKLENDEALLDSLQKIVPTLLRNKNTLRSLVNSSSNIDELITIINDRIEALGNYENIDNAIFNYLKGNKKWNKEKAEYNAENLLKKLKEPIKADYFSNFGISGVVSATSLKQEKDRIKVNSVENMNYEFTNVVPSNLSTFINAITRVNDVTGRQKEDKFDKKLYGTSNTFIGNAWVTDEGVVVFSKDDDLSLFLGLFKREALNVDPQELIPILQEINKIVKFKKYGSINLPINADGELDLSRFDMFEFFNGVLKNGVINESIFETLLEKGKDKSIGEQINKIIKLVTDTIDINDKNLYLATRKLFWSLSPESYGKNKLQEQMFMQQKMEREYKTEIDYKNKRLTSITIPQSREERNNNFGKRITITEDLYENAKNQIQLGRDIVLFTTTTGNSIFVTPTVIYPHADGVYIIGARLESNGELKMFKEVFKKELIFRKREAPIDPYKADENVVEKDGTMLISTEDIPQEVIKRYVRRGDKVSGKLVIGVHPGYIKLVSSKNKVVEDNEYSRIKSFKSALLKEEIDSEDSINPKYMTLIKNSDDITEGDYLIIKTKNGKTLYKRVLLASSDKLWYALPDSKGGYVVKAINREGQQSLKDTYGELTKDEVSNLITEYSNIGRSSATMSAFEDIEKAKVGDYVRIEKNNNYIYGKVLEHNKVYLYDFNSTSHKSVKDLQEINKNNPLFLTNRDISEEFVFWSLKANLNKLNFAKDSNNPLSKRAYYVVPIDTNLDDIVQISEQIFNIGAFKDKVDPKTEKDITAFILDKLGEDSTNNVYFEYESSDSKRYVKNLPNMREITGFNGLSLQQKLDLDVLQKGAYFSMFTKFNDKDVIDFNIYRISDVKGDIVTAQLYKINNGDIITVERIFTKQELLADKTGDLNPINKIAKLYLINKNTKMKVIFEEINKTKKTPEDNTRNTKAAVTLAKKLEKKVKGLPITIEFVKPKGVFKSNQKARIFSDVEGLVKIQVNEDIGTKTDVVHEFMHLFLTPLRYKHPQIYNSLISSVIGEDHGLNVTEAEEAFVEVVSQDIVNQGNVDKIFTNLRTFVDGLKVVINEFAEDYVIQDDNPISLLNISLVDLMDINLQDKSNPLYNKSMLVTEPFMREWLNNNNIILKCN